MVFILARLDDLHSVELRDSVNHKPILDSRTRIIFKPLEERPFFHKTHDRFKVILVKIMPQTGYGIKEKVSPCHTFVQLIHQFFRMEYVKRIIQHIHIKNAFVCSAQRFGNFGIFSALLLGHASSIPDHTDKIQKNHEQFHRRYADIESANFIDTSKRYIFVDTKD